MAFFQRVPEPPLYRRRDEPARGQAKELLEPAEQLLARAWAQEGEAGPLARALEAHLVALALLAEGKVEACEPAWHRARALEREATAPLRLWTRVDPRKHPVFDPTTRTSRFDPHPEALLETKLPCPACRKVGQHTLAPRIAMHRLTCGHCARRFSAYVAELRSLEVEPSGRGRRRYRFRVEEPSGLGTLVEFEDASAGELLVGRRELLAFLYAPESELRGVLNLDSSRVLWITSPACFVATAVFGPDAPELAPLRAFRDEVLARSTAGEAFIAWYYRHGAALAAVVGPRRGLRAVTRGGLRVVVRALEVLR
jgi:hypothetical protein